jgi:hypothetical protein
MASWREVEREAPALAGLARGLFDAHQHKTLATLRRDGSPRISGIQIEFSGEELWVNAMWKSVKALDLRRDPRFALHSGSYAPPNWRGDAKVAGRLVEEQSPEQRLMEEQGGPLSHRFRADITELVVVRLGSPADRLVIESWHPGRGVTRRER